MRCFVSGVGIAADGLPGWQHSQPLLARQSFDPAYRATADDWRPAILPAAMRRRTTAVIRLALQAAAEAAESCELPPCSIASVFASADGDGNITDRICRNMHLPDHPVSPTDFHNSVHNAPAAYWSLCTGSTAASVSIAAGSTTFAAGLLEAATWLGVEPVPAVLLAAYDLPLPAPLDNEQTAQRPFGAALLLSRDRLPGSIASLRIGCTTAEAIESVCDQTLEPLRLCNQAGRALPLLCLLARGGTGEIVLRYSAAAALKIEVEPC